MVMCGNCHVWVETGIRPDVGSEWDAARCILQWKEMSERNRGRICTYSQLLSPHVHQLMKERNHRLGCLRAMWYVLISKLTSTKKEKLTELRAINNADGLIMDTLARLKSCMMTYLIISCYPAQKIVHHSVHWELFILNMIVVGFWCTLLPGHSSFSTCLLPGIGMLG